MKRWTVRLYRVMLLFWFAAASTIAQAEERTYLDITDPSFRKIPVAVPGFHTDGGGGGLSEELVLVTRKDLEISGIFHVLDPRGFLVDPQKIGLTTSEINFAQWKQGGAEFLFRGAYSTDGQNIHMELRFFDVVSGKMALGKAYDGSIRDRKLMIHRFVDEILKLLTGEQGVLSTKIAFVNKEGNVSRIYMVDFDGSNPILLTPREELALSPSWSPDGRLIAYIGYRGNRTSLCLIDPLSHAIQEFPMPGMIMTPRFHPTRGILAASFAKRGDNPDIVVITPQGTVAETLVGGWAIEVSPSWSPDGRKIAYVSGESGSPQVYVYDTTTGSKRRISFSGDYNTSPSWSPKGDLIAYSGIVEGHHQIFIASLDTGSVTQLTHGSSNNEAPTWSPDGRMIAFSSTQSGRNAIWVMLKHGGDARLLTELPGSQILPSWSPRLP